MNRETHPGDTGVARDHHPVQTCRGHAVARAPHPRVRGPYQSGQRGTCGTTPAHRSANGLRFFSPAQVHVAGSVRYVSAATNTPSRNAKTPGYGMGQQAEHEKTSKAGWSRQTEPPYASTGSFRRAVDLPATWRSTGAQDAEGPTMGLRDAIEQRKREPLTPYVRKAWAELLVECGLDGRYPALAQNIADRFSVGIPHITRTYTPPNHASVRSLPDVYSSIVENEFKAGRYIGPFTQRQVESALGPFQTSPLSLVPKSSKP